MTTSYEGALDELVRIALKHVPDLGEQDAVLRDLYGRLSLFLAGSASRVNDRVALEAALSKLAPHVRADRMVVTSDEAGADVVLAETQVQWLRLPGRDDHYRLVDRRVVGVDWLRTPAVEQTEPRRIVFASVKGGVGRSTALCVAARELADEGQRVLVVDLDLEAPGAGRMLAPELPSFGVIDALAAAALDQTIAPAELITELHDGNAWIDVVPAHGRSSVEAPEHYLGKLARAMSEVALPEPKPVAQRVAELVDRLCQRRPYDVVLIDARAGLAEITAGPVLALGATVLLFSTAQQQSFDDYRFLFAHLRSLGLWHAGRTWNNLVPVLAKAGTDAQQLEAAQRSMFELYEEYLYEQAPAGQLDAFNFDETDPDGAHRFVPIAFDTRFASFDPQRHESHLTRPFYEQAFTPFLARIRSLVRPGARA